MLACCAPAGGAFSFVALRAARFAARVPSRSRVGLLALPSRWTGGWGWGWLAGAWEERTDGGGRPKGQATKCDALGATATACPPTHSSSAPPPCLPPSHAHARRCPSRFPLVLFWCYSPRLAWTLVVPAGAGAGAGNGLWTTTTTTTHPSLSTILASLELDQPWAMAWYRAR